jgi:hypothetical protein
LEGALLARFRHCLEQLFLDVIPIVPAGQNAEIYIYIFAYNMYMKKT